MRWNVELFDYQTYKTYVKLGIETGISEKYWISQFFQNCFQRKRKLIRIRNFIYTARGDIMLQIRDAAIDDLERIMAIYRYAQDFMIEAGNPTQWGHFYPSVELIEEDIARDACKVLYDETGIHGVFAVFQDEDPTYAKIEGEWLNDEPYATMHRLAGDGTVHGLFNCASDYCKGVAANVRVDTHDDNQIMQRLFEKNGYKKCGVIYVNDGTPRVAFQWTKQ